jgi:imidazolonepropionase-like amidohydrolase
MSQAKPTFKKTRSLGLTIIVLGGVMAALYLTACSTAAPIVAPVSASNHTITGVAVVDVEKGIVLPDQTVIIEGGLIQAVGPRAELSAPKGAHVIDGRGLYLMPGLVDAHVHYFDPAVFGRLMLANGVLLVRDTGMPNEYILKLRDELNRGETLGPEMVATGAILDGDPPIIPSISLGIKTPEEGRAAVRQQAEAGADMIKVYSRLDKEIFTAIVEEARKHDLKVVAHLPESVYLEDAAAAGLGSSEHFNGFEKVIAKLLGEPVRLSFAGQASQMDYLRRLDEVNPEELQGVYQRLRASGLTICPTVVTFKTLTNIKSFRTGDFPRSEYVSQSVRDLWKSLWAQQDDLPDFVWRNWAQMVAGLNEAGVPLMVGTDLMLPGIIPGYSVHEEMAIWQEAGIPPADVLRSATLVPAQFMGLADRLGSVAEGKSASLVLVRANPLEDIRNAQSIEAIFLRGQYYSRDDLDRLLREARELARPQAESSPKVGE